MAPQFVLPELWPKGDTRSVCFYRRAGQAAGILSRAPRSTGRWFECLTGRPGRDDCIGSRCRHLTLAPQRAPWAGRKRPASGGLQETDTDEEDIVSAAEKTLGKLASCNARDCRRRGWELLVNRARGKFNMSDQVGSLPHKAARFLDHWRTRGAGVWMTTPPWAVTRTDAAVSRGAHKSAHQDREFVLEEMLDFCKQGYWIVMPYEAVRGWPGLRLSPIGAVPQRDRRPRLIVDYSFSDVNAETVLLAPAEAMQFGRALQRVLQTIVEADPRSWPVHLAKIDIADGFYRVWLRTQDIPKLLGVVLPTTPGQPDIIAFPLTLPMGWVESPPYFTALTETACDLTNLRVREARDGMSCARATAHRLESVAATPPPNRRLGIVGTR